MTEQSLAPAQPQLQLTGAKKVAALLITIGTSAAANVLARLPAEAAEAIAAEILQTSSVKPQVRDQVLEEAYGALFSNMTDLPGGPSYALELFVEAFGEQKGMDLLEKVTAAQFTPPFDFLRRIDPAQASQILEGEHPQTIAIVLAHLEPRAAARILPLLDPTLQVDVARRIAMTEQADSDAVKLVEEAISRRIGNAAPDSTKVGGTKPLATVLNQMTTINNKLILAGLRELDAELEEDVRKSMFVFEDIKLINDRDMQKVLGVIDTKDLAVALALKTTDPNVRDKFFKNMSSRAAEMLQDEMSLVGDRVRVKNVEEAQSRIVEKVKKLEDDEEIIIDRGADDDGQ
jgi:flagellar motor switch protein FliG